MWDMFWMINYLGKDMLNTFVKKNLQVPSLPLILHNTSSHSKTGFTYTLAYLTHILTMETYFGVVQSQNIWKKLKTCKKDVLEMLHWKDSDHTLNQYTKILKYWQFLTKLPFADLLLCINIDMKNFLLPFLAFFQTWSLQMSFRLATMTIIM